jgi:hypothetical protein
MHGAQQSLARTGACKTEYTAIVTLNPDRKLTYNQGWYPLTPCLPQSETTEHPFDNWLDPIEACE